MSPASRRPGKACTITAAVAAGVTSSSSAADRRLLAATAHQPCLPAPSGLSNHLLVFGGPKPAHRFHVGAQQRGAISSLKRSETHFSFQARRAGAGVSTRTPAVRQLQQQRRVEVHLSTGGSLRINTPGKWLSGSSAVQTGRETRDGHLASALLWVLLGRMSGEAERPGARTIGVAAAVALRLRCPSTASIGPCRSGPQPPAARWAACHQGRPGNPWAGRRRSSGSRRNSWGSPPPWRWPSPSAPL